MALSILHLSDIHAGPGAAPVADIKASIPGAKQPTMLDRLSDYLGELPTVPDYVVVSGDISNQGKPDGMKLFHSWLFDEIKARRLPDESRILIVPGNHDVKRGTPDQERYKDFAEAFLYAFPHAYIPEHDPVLDADKVKLDGKSPLGGMKAVNKQGTLHLTRSDPFILDLDKDLLLFGFNSTLACGVYLNADPEISQNLATLQQLHKDSEAPLLQKIEEKYKESLLVDAGLIDTDQLAYFADLMRRLRKQIGDTRFANLTKVAVLHHHVTMLWRQQLELKIFEAVVDAAQLKQALIAYGFHFVLHGHKHKNHVALDGTVIGVAEGRALTPLCIVSGGTISGYPETSDKPTFKVLNFADQRGPRRAVTILEVPLLQDADPAAVIRQEAQHYQVTLSSPTAHLNDFNRLKDRLEDRVVNALCAAELEDAEVFVGYGPVRFADHELVSHQGGYPLSRIIVTKGRTLFVDVILASSRLRYPDSATTYSVVSDVKRLTQKEELRGKALLLIGNLEHTPLARTTEAEEVANSIADLLEWYAPAINAGWLEVRTYNFSEEQILEIIGTKPRSEWKKSDSQNESTESDSHPD